MVATPLVDDDDEPLLFPVLLCGLAGVKAIEAAEVGLLDVGADCVISDATAALGVVDFRSGFVV